MSKGKRVQYTLEFKIEAVRLVRGGQSVAAVSQVLGVAAQTLHNWVKAEARGLLKGTASMGRPTSVSASRAAAGVTVNSTVGVRPFPLGAEAGYFTSTSEGEAWRLEVT